MSQQQFEQFMSEQIEAIEVSELTPEEWTEVCAAQFRADWEAANLARA